MQSSNRRCRSCQTCANRLTEKQFTGQDPRWGHQSCVRCSRRVEDFVQRDKCHLRWSFRKCVDLELLYLLHTSMMPPPAKRIIRTRTEDVLSVSQPLSQRLWGKLHSILIEITTLVSVEQGREKLSIWRQAERRLSKNSNRQLRATPLEYTFRFPAWPTEYDSSRSILQEGQAAGERIQI